MSRQAWAPISRPWSRRTRAGGARGPLIVALVALALPQPALADQQGTKHPIQITWTTPEFAADETVVPWAWRSVKGLRPSATLSIQARRVGQQRWSTIQRRVPVTRRRHIWNTSEINPGRAVRYEIRLIVDKPRLVSPSRSLIIDHVPPKVWIEKPEPAKIGSPAGPSAPGVTIVSGQTELVSGVSMDWPDGPSPVALHRRVEGPIWTIEGGIHYVNFAPGAYTLWAIAIDQAGNRGISEPLHVLALPHVPD